MKFRKNLPEQGGSGNFLKLKDQESVTGIFRGNLYEFFVIWENKKATQVPEGTPGAKFRFRINFVVKEGTTYVPKILEQGRVVYDALAAIHEEYHLEQTIIKITRNGSGLNDTTYALLPLLKHEISQETMNYLDKMTLLPLDGQKSKQDDFSFKQDDSDLPF